MRLGLVVVGVVVLVIGAALTFVAVIPQPTQTLSPEVPYYIANVTGVSITGNIPVSISWSASAAVTMAVATCSTTATINSGCNGTSNGWYQNGTSGTFSFNVPDGGAFLAGVTSNPNAANVTLHISLAETTVGLILIVVGILLLVLGVVLKSKKAKAAAASAPMAAPAAPATPPPAQ